MIKVIIVDDEPLLRLGLKSLIHWEENGFTIVGEASNGKEALELIRNADPDIIITDIKMPVMDGIELVREVSRMHNGFEYIVLSCFDDFCYVKEAMKLGAADYLIKSDIKPEQLLEILVGVKQKIEANMLKHKRNIEMADSFNKSIVFLKENFFKDLISGLIKRDEDICEKLKQLNIKLAGEKLLIIKIKLDNFRDIKKIYVEKDEKLLRFAMVNILEEIISNKFNREVVVEKSDEYLVILNLYNDDEGLNYHNGIGRLCKNITGTIKDFLNISLSIGVSNVFSGFQNLKTAYAEAEKAVNMRFYAGKGSITFSDYMRRESIKECNDNLLDIGTEKLLKSCMESMNKGECIHKVEELNHELAKRNISETMIRKVYIRIIEIFAAYLTGYMHKSGSGEGMTPYEGILAMDTLTEIHEYVLNYIDACFSFARNEELIDNKSYVEKAVDIINKYYYEDLSLQTVAAGININPSYLSRIFKLETGNNFVSYLTKIRLEKAKQYLESKKLKVYEVAEKVGYSNYAYFSRIFKKVVGVSPEEYKE